MALDLCESLWLGLGVGQTDGGCFEQNVGVVGAHLSVADDLRDEHREHLTKGASKWSNALFRELYYPKQTSHGIQVLVLTQQLA